MVLKRNKLYKVRELIEAIENVMPELEKEIEDRKKGVPGYGEVDQLEFIKEELEELRRLAVENKLPPKKKGHYNICGFSQMDGKLNHL
ncbi:hypothetical protein TKV_c02510 [Thermoanaerobacter kivui]|uniref:Uncharacterized protein n=1 Tax=Thermoanaerobacter kivui TaxID=2325 RepID=A0A097ANR6_THEKI|nr:hypothetical protein [Thermoanaerobacter kivui]AIS51456.1 hypothetical protein TKV_c02510 [Thermoanaerobacter kivui]